MEDIAVLQPTNSRSGTIPFYLEPWGEEYMMPPGATFEVLARGPRGGSLVVTVADDHIAVWGWAGSVAALSHNGPRLSPRLEARPPVPIMPGEEEGHPAIAASAAPITQRP